MQPIYMKIPVVNEPYRQASPAEPEAPQTAIPGLDVPPPTLDHAAERYQAAADTTSAIQSWKTATSEWQRKYFQNRPDSAARDAVPDTIAFHKQQLETALASLRPDDIAAAAYLRFEGSRLVNDNLTYMEAAAKAKNQNYVNATLETEERNLRATMTAPYTTQWKRQTECGEYIAKATHWKLSQGESPEAVAAWTQNLRKSLTSDGLKARFNSLLETNPAVALRIARRASGETEFEHNNASGGQGAALDPAGG